MLVFSDGKNILDLIFDIAFLSAFFYWLYYFWKLSVVEENRGFVYTHLISVLLLITAYLIDVFIFFDVFYLNLEHFAIFLKMIAVWMAVISIKVLLKNQKCTLEKLEYEIYRDYLTEAVNLKYLKKIWPILKEGVKSQGNTISLIFIDIDGFKEINDKYGHTYADNVLKKIVDNICFELRSNDYLVRYGGDEFIIILPNTGYFNSIKIIKRIKDKVSEIKLPDKSNIHLSCGIAIYPDDSMDLESLIKLADERMYKFKRSRLNT